MATRYRILELLGEGGMGAVYRARDLTLGEDVALKVLDSELADDPDRVDYFRNEVLLARRVTHANVCRLHDIACEDGTWFITMEYIEGISLAEMLRSEDQPEADEVERIFRDVAAGLAAAHSVGVVHRDLKPDNIMLAGESRRAVVADFGIAVELNQLGHAAVDRAGTRGYMSPEQAAGEEIDARTDVFALGVLGHRMLTGELPWIAPTRVTQTDIGSSPPKLPADAPPHLAEVVARCLEPAPSDRPTDAAAVLRLLDGETEMPKRSRRWLGAAAAVLAAGGIAATAVFVGSQEVPIAFAAPRVVVEAVNTVGLESKLRWYDDAFARRLTNELEDAWGIVARTGDDPGDDARASDLAVAVTLKRSDSGQLLASLSVKRFGKTKVMSLEAETFQALAEESARNLIESSVAKEFVRPSALELAQVGIQSVEAWRIWRRAQRGSIRQEWPRVRMFMEAALEIDPGCIPCLIEYAWAFDGTDAARVPPLERAIAESTKRDLSSSWRRVVEFVKADLAGDTARANELVSEVLSDKWSYRERRYFSFRAFAAQWFAGYREASLPMIERHVEQFPRLSGPAKLLSEHYLDLDGDEEELQALRFAERAVSSGPDDVAARSQLARALHRVGRKDDALAQVAIIESADPLEKQHAVAGGERTNSLFDLYMALGDLRGAAEAARRLYNGSKQQAASADEALGLLAFLRGDAVTGSRLISKAISGFEEVELSVFDTTGKARQIWLQYALGDCEATVKLITELPENKGQAHFPVIAALCRGDLEAAEEANQAIGDKVTRMLTTLIIAVERGDWARALAQQDIVGAGRKWIAAYYFLGVAAENSGNVEAALSWHERLAEHRFAWTEPIRSAQSRLAAARLREKAGDTSAARAHYQAFVDRLDKAPPTYPGLANAKKRLAELR